ncbi:hypothetical protein OF117_21235 [Geodermatophilus sp. YIM 151500]|uniref:hypothetical protein n=1 Tax=Geodermatophilus sp. YIM 151500 TaxID=2984531 RepID=UPI0021E4DEEB|nr:hypothetical protein [Geodermatophilus sp. YIM 151500]MCV2491877.1 hypothetical protein [Geodermatophilus sp. YIM 151500]
MSVEPIAADLDLDEVEAALLRAAVGDYAAEAAVLLLANDGYWPARLRAAGLVTIEAEPVGGQMWARIEWPELDFALAQGRLHGSQEEMAVLRVAVSLADGRPVDLADVAVVLDRRALELVLAALAHAAGSQDHRDASPAGAGAGAGVRLGPLIAWPVRD